VIVFIGAGAEVAAGVGWAGAAIGTADAVDGAALGGGSVLGGSSVCAPSWHPCKSHRVRTFSQSRGPPAGGKAHREFHEFVKVQHRLVGVLAA
jgi:hypothetical protein